MSGFTESILNKKLGELNNSSQSIQTLSLWLIHHRKHHVQIVKVWLRELIKVKESKKLTLMYLANDVIQNSRKKGPEFGREFRSHLMKAFENIAETGCDEKTKVSLGRLLKIWRDREVYDDLQIAEYQQALFLRTEPVHKKIKKEDNSNSPRERKKSEREETVEVDGKIETHVHLSPRTPAGDPPETEELIRAILELESNTASTDEVVRQQIAQLPNEVSDEHHLSKLEDKETAAKLLKKVDDALILINGYNTRLATEVDSRKKVTAMMKDFLISQKELLAQAERNLEEYQDKLDKIYIVRKELSSHIKNLPDLKALPDVTGGLAPLPSAGDLFNAHGIH